MAGQTFAYFLTEDPNTTALPLPLQAADRIAVVRGTAGSELAYYAALATLIVSAQVYEYIEPTSGSTHTAAVGLGAYVFKPAALLATLTAVLPPAPLDGQTFTISTTQTITALTVSAPGGATVSGGAVGVLAANGGVSFRYRSADTTWYAF